VRATARKRYHQPMGRARTTAGSFDSVFGRGRGSVEAQAQRDHAEARSREEIYLQLGDRVSEEGGLLNFNLLAAVIDAARTGLSAEEVVATLKEKLGKWVWFEGSVEGNVRDLTYIAKAGSEDEAAVGVVAGARKLLAEYFESAKVSQANLNRQAYFVIKTLFDFRDPETNYVAIGSGPTVEWWEQWAEVITSLGTAIANKGLDFEVKESQSLGLMAISAMRAVPVSAFTSVFGGWAQAFAELQIADALTGGEIQGLELMLANYSAGEGGGALAGLKRAVVKSMG
jgi:hypothetical protein